MSAQRAPTFNTDQLGDHRTSSRGLTRRRVAAIFAFALIVGAPVHSQEPRPLDSEVKAVYLINFGRFATWPPAVAAAAGNVFNVCVLGHDPFGSTLDTTVTGELIDGRKVVVKRIARPQDAPGCRILFVSASDDAELKQILPTAQKASVLTVSDMPKFVELGGMIQFVLESKKVRFQVNATAVDQAGLTLSSELLRVATAVKTTTTP